MSHLVEPEPLETLQFEWGKKRGRGGKNKQFHFYESFSYDFVDYALYDNVYLYKKGEPAPYIGKLIKIWENQNQATNGKKVKVHWFFRPWEISHWVEEGSALERELFLASGDGVGSADVNLLEAIGGKCKVVCTSKDNRNTQPTVQEIESADYFFHRTFDVGNFTISDLTGDKVAGLEVRRVFNQTANSKNTGIVSDNKEEGEISTSVDTVEISDLSLDKTEVKDEVKVAKCPEILNIQGIDSKILEKSPGFTDNKRKTGGIEDFWRSNNGVKAAKDTYAIQDMSLKKPRIDNSVKNCKNGKSLLNLNASVSKKQKKPRNRWRKKKNSRRYTVGHVLSYLF